MSVAAGGECVVSTAADPLKESVTLDEPLEEDPVILTSVHGTMKVASVGMYAMVNPTLKGGVSVHAGTRRPPPLRHSAPAC